MDGEWIHEKVAERALTGTWVIDEVRMTVQKGYEIVEIIEVYEYAVTHYEPQLISVLGSNPGGRGSLHRQFFRERGDPSRKRGVKTERRESWPGKTLSDFHLGQTDGKE